MLKDENTAIGKYADTHDKSYLKSPLTNNVIPSGINMHYNNIGFDESHFRHIKGKHLKALNNDKDSSVASMSYMSQPPRNRMKKQRCVFSSLGTHNMFGVCQKLVGHVSDSNIKEEDNKMYESRWCLDILYS